MCPRCISLSLSRSPFLPPSLVRRDTALFAHIDDRSRLLIKNSEKISFFCLRSLIKSISLRRPDLIKFADVYLNEEIVARRAISNGSFRWSVPARGSVSDGNSIVARVLIDSGRRREQRSRVAHARSTGIDCEPVEMQLSFGET